MLLTFSSLIFSDTHFVSFFFFHAGVIPFAGCWMRGSFRRLCVHLVALLFLVPSRIFVHGVTMFSTGGLLER